MLSGRVIRFERTKIVATHRRCEDVPTALLNTVSLKIHCSEGLMKDAYGWGRHRDGWWC